MDVARLLKDKREQVLEAANRRGAYNIRVFGSIARGGTTEGSDIDLLIDMRDGRSLLDVGGLLMDLRKLLGCKVDIVTTKGLKNSIRDEVLKEALPL